jgi:hypothetical protein
MEMNNNIFKDFFGMEDDYEMLLKKAKVSDPVDWFIMFT